jgi:glycosyltransferase involved in cell wall biosynthesis
MGSWRIGFDYQIFAMQAYGGISRYFCELYTQLRSDPEFEPSAIAPFHVNGHLRDMQGTRKATFLGSFRGASRLALLLDARLERGANFVVNPSLIHETYYRASAPSHREVPRVTTVHDMIPELFCDSFFRGDPLLAAKRASVQRADRVICSSETTRRDLILQYGLPREKTCVVHLGCSTFSRTAPETRGGPDRPARPYLLYVGPRAGYKNFDRLLIAYGSSRRLKSAFDLLAFGGGPWGPSDMSRVHRHSVDPAKVHHRFGGDEILAALYEGASALVYPSLYEGFGMPPLEAMSYGCVPVCSHSGSIPEIAGPAAAYFDPTDPESIRSVLEDVLFSDSRRSELARLGQERVKKFSWQRCASEIKDVYRELLAG